MVSQTLTLEFSLSTLVQRFLHLYFHFPYNYSLVFFLLLFFIYAWLLFFVCLLGVNYQDIGFNGAGLSGGAVSSVGGEQLGGLLAPVSVQNLAALAAMTQQPVVTQAAPIAPAATAAPQPAAPPLCKCASSYDITFRCAVS